MRVCASQGKEILLILLSAEATRGRRIRKGGGGASGDLFSLLLLLRNGRKMFTLAGKTFVVVRLHWSGILSNHSVRSICEHPNECLGLNCKIMFADRIAHII